MGIQSLPGLGNTVSKPALRLVSKGDAGSPLPPDETHQNKVTLDDVTDDDVTLDQRENLGCARGIIMAFGFQAAALILGIALWKLRFLFR